MDNQDIHKKTLRSGKSYDSSVVKIHKTYSLLNKMNNKMKNEVKMSSELHNAILENEKMRDQMNAIYKKYILLCFFCWFIFLISVISNVYLAIGNEHVIGHFSMHYIQLNKTVTDVLDNLNIKII